MQPLTIREHQQFTGDNAERIKSLNLDFSCKEGEIKFLGLNPNLCTSYIIGLDWLNKDNAIQVLPKIPNLDYITMFIECFKSPEIVRELDGIYHIDLDKPTIHTEIKNFQITPLLILHFLGVMRSLVSKGLKKDYYLIEENLNSKVKGKIQFQYQVKSNIYKKRFDRNYCRFQEYSTDCIENRLLKKSLLFAGTYIKKHFSDKKELQSTFNYCYSIFQGIGDNFDLTEIKRIRINPIYKEYAEALKLAKMILKNFGYALSEVEKNESFKSPPFRIDLSLLFECYVSGKLKDEFGSSIKYQQKGKYGNVDFLDIERKIVIDTKYKLIYNNPMYDIENIRQISGYARDINIRKKLNAGTDDLLPCCIIYPNFAKESNFENRNLLEEKVGQFEKFWKIGISLPLTTIV